MLTIPLYARHFSYLDPVDRRTRTLAAFLLLVIAILGVASGTPISVSAQELPTALPEEVGMSSSRLDRLTGALQEYVNTNRIPGAVAMVLRDGRVVYHEAVGKLDIEADVPMGQDVIFRIASQTKALVSVAIMMLQEDGDLLISDPVSKYIPSLEATTVAEAYNDGYQIVAARRPITVRDLLTHTAGIGYGWDPGGEAWHKAGITGWYFAHRNEPMIETVNLMATLPFQAQPGERFVYGYSTDILGAVVEVVSGRSLDEFLKNRIFEPLGMHDTHFYLPIEKKERLATVYSLTDKLRRAPEGSAMETQGQYVEGPRRSFSGGAGLLSTARDYSRFLQMLLNEGQLNGTRVLSPSSVSLMTKNHVGDLYIDEPGMGFGLGFSVRLDVGAAGVPGSEGEYGWGGAYHSTYWVDPTENLIVLYFTQVIPANELDDHQRLRALIYSAITEPASTIN